MYRRSIQIGSALVDFVSMMNHQLVLISSLICKIWEILNLLKFYSMLSPIVVSFLMML